MSDTVIISLAPVAADCPRVIPEELAQEILASVEYGAAIVHLHVRDKQGRLTPDTVDFHNRPCNTPLKPDNSGLYRRRLFAVHRRTLRAVGLLRCGDGIA